GRHQRIVEALVALAPFALDADRVVLPWRAELVEEKIRADDLGFPAVGAVTDGVGQGAGLEIDAQLAEIEEVGERDRRHGEAAAGLSARQAFRYQMRQRLA